MSAISKQVIVMRKDLKNVKGEKVRTGKLISQGAHASLAALLGMMSKSEGLDSSKPPEANFISMKLRLYPDTPLLEWITGRFTKITTCVNTLEELMVVYNQAKDKGLPCALITDAGNTEFNGEPTVTCCAIGPAWDNEIDPITGGLSLF